MINSEIAEQRRLLDEVRGVLCYKSNNGGQFLAPISSIALTSALQVRQVDADIPALLRILCSLKDVQELRYGHWIPVPTHKICFDQCSVLISGYPSRILEKDFEITIGGSGIGRLALSTITNLTQIPLSVWLGAPASSPDWCEQQIREASFGDPLGWDDLDVFNHWSSRSVSRWLPASGINRSSNYVFARTRSRDRPRSYHLIRLGDNKVNGLHDFPVGFDSRRFSLNLLARSGNAYTFSLSESHSDAELLRAPFLPEAESRALRVLGPVYEGTRGIEATIPASSAAAVRTLLLNLSLTQKGSLG